MNNLVRALAVVGVVFSYTLPVNADDYISSYKYTVNGVEAPVKTVVLDDRTKVIEQSAVVGPCGTKVIEKSAVLEPCSNIKVQSAVIDCPTTVRTMPVVVEHEEKKKSHLFHLGVWPLVDFSLF